MNNDEQNINFIEAMLKPTWQETPEGLLFSTFVTEITVEKVQKVVEWCHEYIGANSSDFEWMCEVDKLRKTKTHSGKFYYYSIADLKEEALTPLSYLRFFVTIPNPEYRVMFKLVWDGVDFNGWN